MACKCYILINLRLLSATDNVTVSETDAETSFLESICQRILGFSAVIGGFLVCLYIK